MSLVERKSRRAMTHSRCGLMDRVHTLTFDNSRAFSDPIGIAADLKARVCFAPPYASWKRGANESTHGRIHLSFA
ncbi:transposase, IS30 family, partial [mine drainage metagenome]